MASRVFSKLLVYGVTIALSVLIFLMSQAFSLEPTEQWIVRYNGPGNGVDHASSVQVDGDGNLYVTGSSSGDETSSDYATIKYDPDGNELWVSRYDGPGNGNDGAESMGVDVVGNVYVTGSGYVNPDLDYVTIKYNSDGSESWIARYNGPSTGDDVPACLVLDGASNVYVTGMSDGASTQKDYATIKYDNEGNELWLARYNGPSDNSDWAHAVTVDNSEYVYITGSSWGLTSVDYATIKYDPDGNEVWVRRYNGGADGYDTGSSIAVDQSGNVYVSGTSTEIATREDYATIKYDPDGNEVWVRRYNGPGNDVDVALSMAIDESGNIYVTGFSGADGGNIDYATIKYDADGNELWVRRYDGSAGAVDSANSLALDKVGNVYVTGDSAGEGSSQDYVSIKYDTNGEEQWVMRYNGPDEQWDGGFALAVDNIGNVYVTGDSEAVGTDLDYATIKYTQGGPHPPWGAPASIAGTKSQSTSDTLNYLLFLMVPIGAVLLWRVARRRR